MEKLQRNHTRWLKDSSSNYKNCRWDIFAEEWANLHHHHHTVKSFVNVHVLGSLYRCCALLRLFLLNWIETTWLMSLLLLLSSYWEDPSQSAVNQSVKALCSIMWCWLLASSMEWGFCSHLMYFMVLERVCLYFIENWLSYFLCFLRLLSMVWYSMSSWN